MSTFAYICIQKLWNKLIIEIIGMGQGVLLVPKRAGWE